MKKYYNRGFTTLLFAVFFFYSCSNELVIEMPEGPAGPKGLSAYEIWVQAVKDGTVDWDADRTDINNFFLYLKGTDGKDGANGQSAYDLWKSEVAKGIANPHNPSTQWSKDKTTIQDFWYFLTGANGQDGSTPIIGPNGNWFINGTDTKIPAKGKDGTNGSDGKDGANGSDGKDGANGSDGKDGTNGSNGKDGKNGSVIDINDKGNWVIDGIDTGVTAFGKNGKDGTNGSDGKDGANGSDGKDGANGSDGKDGSNGKDGKNGQSAYDLWKEEVAKGIEDPHNPGKQWSKEKTTTKDFWDFLRGEDGKDGETEEPGGETGQPGADITIVAGKPNVIAQYVNQSYNEFVRWEDGGVGYIVYNNNGEKARGARVKGMPGVKDPDKVYVADPTGFFSIPKEDLPDNEDITKRRGTVEVRYAGENITITSAPNTYVPNRMYIRINLKSDPVIDGIYMKFAPIVERKTDSKDWEVIPSYLGDLKQTIIAYSLGNSKDPTSYDEESEIYSASEPTVDISSNIATLKINRLRKKADYYPTPENKWDEKAHYFTLVLDSYYGEAPQINAVIKMAPIQAMPMIKEIKAFGYESTGGYFKRMEGKLDIANADIDESLLYKNELKKENKTSGGSGYIYYSPEVDDPGTYNNAKQFTIRFRVSGNSAFDSNPSISSPDFSFTTPYIESSVILECSSSYFYPLNTIGYLRFEVDEDLSTLKIVKRNDPRYVFPDIPVSYSAQ